MKQLEVSKCYTPIRQVGVTIVIRVYFVVRHFYLRVIYTNVYFTYSSVLCNAVN
jgi:hypothetical protein